MEEYRKVVYEEDSSKNTAIVAVFVITIAALIMVGLFVWQPWAIVAPTPSTNTTVIKESAPAAPARDTIIVPSAPAAAPAKTEISIKNENPPAEPKSEEGSGSSEESGSTSGSTAGEGTSSEPSSETPSSN